MCGSGLDLGVLKATDAPRVNVCKNRSSAIRAIAWLLVFILLANSTVVAIAYANSIQEDQVSMKGFLSQSLIRGYYK
jgi:hypothetical protein